MNYPYGEHLIYADCQPLLTGVLQLFQGMTSSLEAQDIIAIIHILISASLLWSSWLLFLILKRLNIPPLFSAIFAILIAFMSPQLYRLHGHLGLAYTSFIPLIWYLLINNRYKNTQRMLYLSITLLVFGAIHPYLFLIGGLFIFLFSLTDFAYATKKSARLRSLILTLAAALIPILGFRLFMLITDPVTDRPIHPYGFFAYETYWEGVFLPQEGQIWELINQWVNVRDVNFEGRAYVGLVGTLIFLLSIFSFLRKKLRGKYLRSNSPVIPIQLQVSLIAASVILVFSASFPFNLGLRWLVDLLPILKQFRALGRFAWVFYYVFSVFTTVIIYQTYSRLRQDNKQIQATLLLCSSILIWSWEVYDYLKIRKGVIDNQVQNIFVKPNNELGTCLNELQLETSQFQGIIPIPYFHIGSEKFAPPQMSEFVFRQSLLMAYQTGIPLATRVMPRASLKQTLKQVQMISHPHLVEREIMQELDDDRSFLLLADTQNGWQWNEVLLTEKAIKLCVRGRFALYELPYSALSINEQYLWNSFHLASDTLNSDSSALYTPPGSGFYYYSSIKNAEKDLNAPGLYSRYEKEADIILFDQVLSDSASVMQFSLWVKADLRRDAFSPVYYYQYDKDGREVDYQKLNAQYSTDILRNWIRIEHNFQIKNKHSRIKIQVKGHEATISSFLIKPKAKDVYKQLNDSVLMFNNFYINH